MAKAGDSMARLRLLSINPVNGKTREFRIAKRETTIGSARGNTIVLHDATVSRRHAMIRAHGGCYELLDLKSTNGTFVNDRRIFSATTLADGDNLRLGAVALVFGCSERARWSQLGSIVRAAAIVLIFFVSAFGLAKYLGEHGFLDDQTTELPGRVGAAWVAPYKTRLLPVANEPSRRGGAASTPSPHASGTHETATLPEPGWLTRINYYRAMAKLAPLQEDRALSESDSRHARYLMMNYGDAIREDRGLGDDEQEERADKPGYSEDGAAVAIDSEVSYGCGSFNLVDEIDRFMSDAFHRLALFSPDLERAAMGSDIERGCWTAAVRIPVSASNPRTFDRPVEFPPDGATVSLHWMSGEWPEPLTACPGYQEPVGLPISLEIGRMIPAQLSAHSLSENGRPIEHCAFDNVTYTHPNPDAQEYARRALREFGAVVLIPRERLHGGANISVSVTARGQTYTWAFKTAKGAR